VVTGRAKTAHGWLRRGDILRCFAVRRVFAAPHPLQPDVVELAEPAIVESLTSIKRAGADLIISYWAEALAKLLPLCTASRDEPADSRRRLRCGRTLRILLRRKSIASVSDRFENRRPLGGIGRRAGFKILCP
jgi:hypothetical protein